MACFACRRMGHGDGFVDARACASLGENLVFSDGYIGHVGVAARIALPLRISCLFCSVPATYIYGFDFLLSYQ